MRNYCIAIHVPIYSRADKNFVTSEWYRALCLLRDSFEGRFDNFIVVAPQGASGHLEHDLVEIGNADGFEPRPSIPRQPGKRQYWRHERAKWRKDVADAMDISEIGHVGAGDLYQPLNFDAADVAFKRNVTSVFIHDTDTVTQMRNLIANGGMRGGPDRKVYEWAYDHVMKRAVSRADLSLLKGEALYNRYAPSVKFGHTFHDTSYSEAEIVDRTTMERRLATLGDERPLRFVYCGRLVPRKGLAHAISIVKAARDRGANVTFDIIGDGEIRSDLDEQIRREGVGDHVRLLGARPYDAELLRDLSTYDALLFTPMAEDTPRMIFDAYAAGLPIVGYDIPYMQERAAQENAAALLSHGEISKSADVLIDLDRTRARLGNLARNAHKGAFAHSADAWYRQRAAWTMDVHNRQRPVQERAAPDFETQNTPLRGRAGF